MNDYSQTSKSFPSKIKRGLSLSLQKKKINLNQQDNENFSFLKPKPSLAPEPTRNNRIKFVQSYTKNKGSQTKNKGKFFKNTNEDIKLGGSKKYLISSNQAVEYPRRSLFSDYDFNIPTVENSTDFQKKVPLQSEKKISREGNLNWKINYFQKIKMQDHLILPTNNSQNINLEKKHENTVQDKNLIVSCQPQIIQQVKGVQIIEGKDKIEDARGKQREIREYREKKQSIEKERMQKLKQVQSSIDQLLCKVSQTRAYLLR